jgi:CMP-N-acetylneuraminic acid synthetase
MKPVLALITARGGSQGIIRKNVRVVGGRPLIAWSIAAAQAAPSVGRIVVSTDDDEIAAVSREYGAEVPFRRPADLARDDSSHMAVVVHAVEWLADHDGYRPRYVLLLQPTSPLRTAEDIETAVRLAEEKGADSIVSVSDAEHAHPFLARKLTADGRLVDYLPATPSSGVPESRRQALPQAYFLNGAIYLTAREMLLRERSFQPERTWPYIMPTERSLQVDDLWELRVVDLILRDRAQAAGGPTEQRADATGNQPRG